MDEKRLAELRLIQAAIGLHVAEIAYQKSVERAGIFSVEDRMLGKGIYEAERSEYIKRRVELTMACEQYAKLFTPEPAPALCSACGCLQSDHDDDTGVCRSGNPCVCAAVVQPAQAGGE